MELAELREKIADCLATNLDTDKNKLMSDAPFSELDYDSLTMAEIIFMLEDEFNVRFDDLKTSDYPSNLSELAAQVAQLMPEAQQC
ncbi:acyl carrier protein [Herbaspirillum sp. HC18]|nr:acyl carrier protein [Herbaspirillum sp. HC18]